MPGHRGKIHMLYILLCAGQGVGRLEPTLEMLGKESIERELRHRASPRSADLSLF